jgi:hypothetical protein
LISSRHGEYFTVGESQVIGLRGNIHSWFEILMIPTGGARNRNSSGRAEHVRIGPPILPLLPTPKEQALHFHFNSISLTGMQLFSTHGCLIKVTRWYLGNSPMRYVGLSGQRDGDVSTTQSLRTDEVETRFQY